MSGLLDGKTFIKISELTPTTDFGAADEFAIVHNAATVKITGQSITDSVTAIGNLASKGYVDTLVDGILGGAPGTLDTLNELAMALNDDANFASAITSLVNTKLNSYDFGLRFWDELRSVNTYHISEGNNLYFTNQRAIDAIGANPVFGDITVDNIAFAGTGAVTIRSNNDLNFVAAGNFSLNGNPIFSGNYNDLTDKPTLFPGDYDLLINKPTLFSGSYNDLTDQPVLFGGSYNDLTDQPSIPTDINQLTDTSGLLGHGTGSFSGDYNDLTNKPTIPSAYTLPTATTTVLGGVKVGAGLSITNGVLSVTATGTNGSFTSLSATDLTVQNVTFSGVGAVALNSNNDLNINAVGTINLGSITALPGKTRTQLAGITSVPAGSIAYCSNATGGACPVWFNGTSWLKLSDNGAI
ncbi:hypothetical protein UFOVP71_288 [uncultured Caudovirales phage]|uniref:Uncharacterized protein n=1 Tax=uncultured Caudovirales phage TaxID=2100421 RepID=A0A6J5TDM9_9CAUD|nr:hypothetical protein UFOVP71_288 [uncultured Caudovirales phage]